MPIIMKNNIAYAGSYDNQVKQLKLAEYIELEKAGKTNSDTVYFIEDANEEIAKNIAYDNTDTGLEATDMQSAIDELNSNLESCFQSVSDGKSLVASAITDKGVTTASDATFETMANNITSLETGGLLKPGQALIMSNAVVNSITDINTTKTCSITSAYWMCIIIRNNGWTKFSKNWTDATRFASITNGVIMNHGTAASITVDPSTEYIIAGRYTDTTSTTLTVNVS